MKRPAQKVTLGKVAIGVVVASASMPLIVRLFLRVRCSFRGFHNPVKHPVGGFRCSDCAFAGETLEDLGFKDSSQVDVLRKTFDRGPRGGITRSEGYDAETREQERRQDPPPARFIRGARFERRA